jgi:uncharacterized damage-inducible protein DinB
MTNDPTLLAAGENIGDSLEELRKAVAALTADQLNTRPAGEDSNPLGVIASHALGSTRSWLALATGAPLPSRDRPAEFRTVVEDADEFLANVDEQNAAILALIEAAETFDPSRTGIPTWMPTREGEPVTAAWALQHALAHLGEHVGHAQLTRQLFDA